jgi:Trk-type K+ transport system membrane component
VGAYFFVGVIMVMLGSDIVTGFSASLAAVGNIGPGFGEAGPMGNFAGFSDPAKVVLTLAMWVGRLEIVTILALLHVDVWRNLHLRAFSRQGAVRERARREAAAATATAPGPAAGRDPEHETRARS